MIESIIINNLTLVANNRANDLEATADGIQRHRRTRGGLRGRDDSSRQAEVTNLINATFEEAKKINSSIHIPVIENGLISLIDAHHVQKYVQKKAEGIAAKILENPMPIHEVRLSEDKMKILESLVQGKHTTITQRNELLEAALDSREFELATYLLLPVTERDFECKTFELATFIESIEKASDETPNPVLEFLLSPPNKLVIKYLQDVLLYTNDERSSEVIDRLVHLGIQFDDKIIETALSEAVQKKDTKSIENINEIVNRLQIPMRYIDILANIALIAFEKDPQDCFEKIIEIGKNIKNNFKITVLAKAIEEKNTACMNAINLDLSLISIKQRDALLLVAAFNDLKDMTKTLLESGPTTQYKRNLIFNLISNTEIKSILSPYQNVLDPPKPPISFKDVEENPQMHLDQIAEDGIPDFITLEEDPVAIDAGGLTQQYISTLLTACIKNGIIQSSHGMAIVIDESAKDLENIGKLGEFFNQIALWNPYSKKKFFMPWIFEPRFYDLIGTIVKNPKTSDELLLVQVAKSLETEDDAVAAKLVLDPDNQELKDLYSEAMLLDDDEDPIKIAEGEMLTYVQAAKLLSSKLEESTRRLLKKLPADQICSTFQGIPSSSETLLASLQYDKTNEDPLFQQEVKWIKEKIENATPEWRKQFVQSITGNENLGPGIKIKITANRYSNGQIVVHTCNQTLELPTSEDPPTDDDAQKNFLSALDFAIEYKGYNTA